MHTFGIAHEVIYRSVGLDVHDSLTNGTASLPDTFLAFLVGKLHVLLLHRPSGLLLHHDLDIVIVLLKTNANHVRCDIRGILAGQVLADVKHGRIEGCNIVCVPPVMSLTLGDVARFDVLGSFGYCTHIKLYKYEKCIFEYYVICMLCYCHIIILSYYHIILLSYYTIIVTGRRGIGAEP